MTSEDMDVHVRSILATLEGLSPPMVRAFGMGLSMSGGAVSYLAEPVRYYATCREYGETESPLVLITGRSALRKLADEGRSSPDWPMRRRRFGARWRRRSWRWPPICYPWGMDDAALTERGRARSSGSPLGPSPIR